MMEIHSVSAKQQGELGEALLTGHSGYAIELVRDWVWDTLKDDSDIGDDDTIRVTHDPRVETYYVRDQEDHKSWEPDCLFTAWVEKSFGPLKSSDERRIDVPMEIKTGQYAELERNQRDVMTLVATEFDVVPVVADVDLAGLPDEFGLDLRRMEGTTDQG